MNFSIFEKKALIAGLFVTTLFAVSFLVIGKRNLWFEPKVEYTTYIKDADGLSEGSLVTMSGLRVGEVKSLAVEENNLIKVNFSVSRKLSSKVKTSSVARLYRAFVIGEKRIELVPGEANSPEAEPLAVLKSQESMEIPDLISGKNLQELTARFEGVNSSLEKWLSALNKITEAMDPDSLAKTYSLLIPTLDNLNRLSSELLVLGPFIKELQNQTLDKKLLAKTLKNTNETLAYTGKILKPISKREVLLEQVLDNVNVLSNELAQNPTFSRDLLNTLNEVTITLKAIQKTWILKGHVEDVKKQ